MVSNMSYIVLRFTLITTDTYSVQCAHSKKDYNCFFILIVYIIHLCDCATLCKQQYYQSLRKLKKNNTLLIFM